MAETWSKRQREQKKRNAKRRKVERRQERKDNNSKGKGLNEMLAYVDEYGNLTEIPPERRADPFRRIPRAGTGSRPSNDDTKEKKGIVIFFDHNKGYGFIKNAYARESVFVHASSSAVELEENMKVTYELKQSPKGMAAVNVKAVR